MAAITVHQVSVNFGLFAQAEGEIPARMGDPAECAILPNGTGGAARGRDERGSRQRVGLLFDDFDLSAPLAAEVTYSRLVRRIRLRVPGDFCDQDEDAATCGTPLIGLEERDSHVKLLLHKIYNYVYFRYAEKDAAAFKFKSLGAKQDSFGRVLAAKQGGHSEK